MSLQLKHRTGTPCDPGDGVPDTQHERNPETFRSANHWSALG